MVVGVDPPPSLAQPGAFQVASGDAGTLPTDARPVLGPQLATGVVLDTSAAGAGALQGGINGTTNLLLQLPDGVRNLVVADGGRRPAVALAADPGRDRGGGRAQRGPRRRQPAHRRGGLGRGAGRAARRGRRSRLLLLYTGAAGRRRRAGRAARPAAGGRPGVVLAVVDRPAPTSATGRIAAGAPAGCAVPAAGPASLRPFDRVAAALRGRFVLTFPRPPTLPATVRVSMTAARQTRVAVRCGAGGVGQTSARGPAGADGSVAVRCGCVGGALVLLALLVGGGLLLARRRPGTGCRPTGAVCDGGDAGRLPSPERPAIGPADRPRVRRRPRADCASPGRRQAEARATAHPGRTARPRPTASPGTSCCHPGDGRAQPGDQAPAQPRTSRPPGGRPQPGDRAGYSSGYSSGQLGTPGRLQLAGRLGTPGRWRAGSRARHLRCAATAAAIPGESASGAPDPPDPARAAPGGAGGRRVPRRARRERTEVPRTGLRATDGPPAPRPRGPPRRQRRGSTRPPTSGRTRRLDEETSRVAADVAAGRMEFAHAVARISMAAPGRVDLLDRVIETERRLDGHADRRPGPVQGGAGPAHRRPPGGRRRGRAGRARPAYGSSRRPPCCG